MLAFGFGLIFVSLLIMMYEDYRYRAISVKFLATFFLGSFLFGFIQNEPSVWLVNSLLNSLLLAFLVFVIQLYYKLRFRSDGWFVDSVMGRGDLLFFLALGFMFSPLSFLVTLCFLSLLSIVFSLPVVIGKGVQHKLPLISYMGVGLILEFVMVYKYDILLGNDSQLLFLMEKWIS